MANTWMNPDVVFSPEVTEYATPTGGSATRCSASMQRNTFREFDDVAIDDILYALRFAVVDWPTMPTAGDKLTFRGETVRVLGRPRRDQINVFFKVAVGDEYARRA